MKTFTKTIQLQKGQTLDIDGFSFKVEKNCDLTLKGQLNYVSSLGFPVISDYTIESDAITITEELKEKKKWSTERVKFKGGEEYQETTAVNTYTDIGGHYIYVKQPNSKVSETIAMLSNGFGDGRYTLRFVEGKHFR